MIRLWLGFSILSVMAGACASAQVTVPAAQWLPAGAVMGVEIKKPAALLDLALDLKILDASKSTSTDVQGLIRLFDALGSKAGTDWKGIIRKLTAGGVIYAMYPNDTYVVTLDAEDAASLEQVQQFAQLLANGAGAAKRGAFYKDLGTATIWSLDGKLFFAKFGKRLVATNRAETLKVLFAPRTQGSLASSPMYIAAMKVAAEAATAFAFVNMAMLNKVPSIEKALTADSPIGILLDGAVLQSMRESNWMAMSLQVDGRNVLLHAASDGKTSASGAEAFTLPVEAGQGILPNLAVPRQLAAVSLWRDLGKFYATKDALFPEKSSGAILLENFLEIFFTGRDLAAEVFAKFHPEVRLVAARQQYDPAIGTPQEQYPAAALIFRVDHPEEFGEVFEEAWQKAVGLTNFTRGQQAQQGLIIDKASHGGAPITYCYFSPRNEKDKAHLASRFNLRPALARVGPYLILSTTDSLAKDVIDAVNQEDGRVPAKRSNAHTLLEISNGTDIAALLATNRNELIRQSVVGSSKKPEQAEAELASNMAILQHLDHVRFSLSATAEGQQADLELRIK